MTLQERWLDFILHLSSTIYKLKKKTLKANIFKTIFLFIIILVLQILLFLISLPTNTYIRIKESLMGNNHSQNQVKKYSLRQDKE